MAHVMFNKQSLKGAFEQESSESRQNPYFAETCTRMLTLLGLSYEALFTAEERELHQLRDKAWLRNFYKDNANVVCPNASKKEEEKKPDEEAKELTNEREDEIALVEVESL